MGSTDLPDDSDSPTALPEEPFLPGHPILPEDMDLADLPPDVIEALNQDIIKESREARGTSHLVSNLEHLSALIPEYEGAHNFPDQINYLIDNGYDHIRRIGGEGNCFYRGLAFVYVEQLVWAEDKLEQLAATQALVESYEGGNLFVSDAVEILNELVLLEPTDPSTSSKILEAFNEEDSSNYIVAYMRMLTASYMRQNSQDFNGFLLDQDCPEQSISLDDFCTRFVIPYGKEADTVQIVALTQALKVAIKIAYLDGKSKEACFHSVPKNTSGGHESVVLLYRPGHYDILQKGR